MARFIVYQLGLKGVWCACVFGALWGLPWLGPAVAIPWLFWHVKQQDSPSSEAALVLGAGACGAVGDLVLIRLGGLEYAGLAEDALLGPAWIVALWMVFATTVNATLGWLGARSALAAALGVVGGICAYVGGRKLGVAEFDLTQPETLLSLVVVWGFAVPLLLRACGARRWDAAPTVERQRFQWTRSTPAPSG
jgi:hypothetical protein